ncbi:MAG: hypothetical protein ABSF82_13500 [Candidatus Bathyarchaeia archaeon]
MNNVQRTEAMIAEARRIIAGAKERNLHLRLLGAIAFQIQCPKYNYLSRKLNRILTDLDFAGYSREGNKVAEMMKEFGYADEPTVTALFGHRRMIWDNKSNGHHADIFFDKLEMNHDIPFERRLDIDDLTIPLADMLLEKMQIVHINQKDIIDTIMILREHAIVKGHAQRTIDASYISKLLSGDWGFYYTMTTNLQKIESGLAQLVELSVDDRADISGKIEELLAAIEKEPKALSWRLRAKVGPKGKWYKDVEEVNR